MSQRLFLATASEADMGVSDNNKNNGNKSNNNSNSNYSRNSSNYMKVYYIPAVVLSTICVLYLLFSKFLTR